MAKIVKCCALLFSVLTVGSVLLYQCLETGIWLTLAITFGTCAYHFVMRLAVGWGINGIFHNRMDPSHPWFRSFSFEQKLYKKLRLSRWKGRMPTYDPTLFSFDCHTPDEIVGAMCQAEVVHEVIVCLSFLPLLAAIPFGELGVFLLTSLAAATFDLLFVLMQRYNRPRLLKIIRRRHRN